MSRALVAFLLAAPLLAEETSRLPLPVLGKHFLRTGDERALPMAAIGAPPEGSAPLPSYQALLRRLEGARGGHDDEISACEELTKALSEGSLALAAPRPGVHVLVFLVGPLLNDGESWEPSELAREGNTFTLTTTSWRDNRSRRRNVPRRPTILMTLGELGPGDYELVFTYRGMFQDVEKGEPHHALNALHEGVLPFHVAALPDAEDQAVTLPQGALRVAAIERTEPNQGRPFAKVYRLPMEAGEGLKPSVRVGSLDLASWARPQDGGPTGPPQLDPPAKHGPLIACVVGPRLDSMEWMSLAAVTWEGDGVQLTVEVWRDSGERDKNAPYTPLLIVPIDRPRKGGTYRVEVEWVTLAADVPGGLYRPEHDSLLEPVHTDFAVR